MTRTARPTAPRRAIIALIAVLALAAVTIALAIPRFTGVADAAQPADFRGLYVATRPLLARAAEERFDFAASPASGVYIRLAWRQVEPRPGVYDWRMLDAAADAALAAGKKISLSMIAGGFTPDWMPQQAATSTFSVGKGGANRRCTTIVIGHPWDARYQQRYVGTMTALAAHLRAKPAAYAAVRIVKMTAIAQNTEELRLPSTDGDRQWRGRTDPCDESDAIATWSRDGYTADGVVAGWSTMATGVGRAFPDKIIAQDMLERNDFPPIGGGAADVKRRIVDAGMAALRGRFAVQWNGLTADGPLAQSVVAAGRRGAIVGWQTNAFRGLEGAGCNADRLAQAAICSPDRYGAILRRGIAAGAGYIEIWRPDAVAFPEAVRAAEAALRQSSIRAR